MSKLKKNYFPNKRGVYNKRGGLHVWLLFNALGGVPFIRHRRVDVTSVGLSKLGLLTNLQYLYLHIMNIENLADVINSLSHIGLRELSIFGMYTNLEQDCMEAFSKLTTLTVLNIGGNHISSCGLSKLTSLKKLQCLYMSNCFNVSIEMMKDVGNIGTSLLELDLSGCAIDDECLIAISKITSLRKLSLGNRINRSSVGLSYLTGTSITELSIGGLSLDEECIKNIFGIPSLNVLKLNNTVRFATCHISGLHLTHLSLFRSGVGDDGCLKAISNVPSMKVLDISFNYHITHFGLSYLSCSNLLELRLDECHLYDECYASLGTIKSLHKLDITGNGKITPINLNKLTALSNLKSLNLSNCHGVTAKCIEVVSKLSLTELNIGNCNVRDACLAVVRKISSLKMLHLFNSDKITAAGLINVSKLKALHYLDLNGCKKISTSDLKCVFHVDRVDHFIDDW